ncbi:MAG: hypothetical protein ACJAWY_001466 [Sphingomonas echinoides]|jgi:hypothetical protein
MVNLAARLGKGRWRCARNGRALNAALARPWHDERVNAAFITMPARPHRRGLPPMALSLLLAAVLAFGPMLLTLDPVAALARFSNVSANLAFGAFCALLGIAVVSLAALAILRRLGVAAPERSTALFAIAPSLLLQPGLNGLSDAFWIAACLMALAAALDRRHMHMLRWWGTALAFDPHAMFVAPLLLALLINRHVPVHRWAVAPLISLATLAVLFAIGWPMPGWESVFAGRADGLPPLSANAPNIWAIVQALPLGALSLSGLARTATIGVSAAYIARFSAQRLNGRSLIAAALLAALIMGGLLPYQQADCFLLADLLALILALARHDRASWRVAMLVQAGSALGLVGDRLDLPGFAMLGAVALLSATLSLARTALQPAANDNPLMARPPART